METCEHCGGSNFVASPPGCWKCGAPQCCADCCNKTAAPTAPDPARAAAELIDESQRECGCPIRVEIIAEIVRAAYAPLVAEVEKLRGALTASDETKAAYHGEFQFEEDSPWGSGTVTKTVPWTTIKEIMAAILKRAIRTNHERPD